MRELLVVIDYQNDFVTGALGNPAAAALEPGIAARVAAQLERGGRVLFTRDTHGTDYLNTREGRFLPVAHCIKGSQGWGLYGSLSQYETGVRDGVSIVDKPTFGCAALPAEAEALCGGAPDSIEICGVVTDICVVSNAVLLHSAFLNARVAVLKDLCAAATPEGHARALALLAGGFLQLPQQADVGLALLFAMAFGAGNTNRVLAKWAQDSEYQKHVMDERNLAIKEKAGNITNMFTTTLLGIAIVVFLCMGYVFPAVVLGGVVVAQLVSLIFVSSLLEKKM